MPWPPFPRWPHGQADAMRLPTLIAAACLATCINVGCDGARGTGGIQVSESGASFDTASAAKRKAERTITNAISDSVGVTWRVGTTVDREPAWDARTERWLWQEVGATVTLAGSGDLPDGEDGIRQAVVDYLRGHQAAGAPAPQVNIRVVRQLVAAEPRPIERTPTNGWSYELQPGDTLALISSAFYGTPNHWRRILEANPGLAADRLEPGTTIVVPPAP